MLPKELNRESPFHHPAKASVRDQLFAFHSFENGFKNVIVGRHLLGHIFVRPSMQFQFNRVPPLYWDTQRMRVFEDRHGVRGSLTFFAAQPSPS